VALAETEESGRGVAVYGSAWGHHQRLTAMVLPSGR